MPLPLASDTARHWISDPAHRAWLQAEAQAQFRFFRRSLRAGGGFAILAHDGTPIPGMAQELHSTTRMVHSYALGHCTGLHDAPEMIDAGMDFLWNVHRDGQHGGYVWAVKDGAVSDGVKLAYGHVFVLLAASSAKMAGHPDADRLLADVAEVLDRHYWDDSHGLFRDEFTRDWQPFSTYRGMNANMHGVEALLAAHEATGDGEYLSRAGRILDFLIGRMAPAHDWRIPEHYSESWQVDAGYRGNPMFRPAGTTPGHSFEFARLTLQHWDLSGRPDTDAPQRARALVTRAMADAWLPGGGLAYTLHHGGAVDMADRYWWPVTEAIGALQALMKADPRPGDEDWYRQLWRFADAHFIDHDHGGWFPEIDADGRPTVTQFHGKPDIYHSVQAAVLPLSSGLSRLLSPLQV